MRIRTAMAVAAVVAALAPSASAQPKPGAEVRRDPAGTKGISPYMEELAKGRTAFQRKDTAAAIAAFDAAIAKDPERLLGYLLKAQAQLAKGDLDGAFSTAAVGRTKNGTEPEQGKLLFLSAELEERKANTKPGEENEVSALERLKLKWDTVKDAWARYVTHQNGHPAGPDFKASAEERQLKIDARVKRDADYAQVKKRIADNQADIDKKQ
jgi:hypothetical protein